MALPHLGLYFFLFLYLLVGAWTFARLQFIKMALPHLGLYFFLFLYLLVGAWTFARIEDATDRRHQFEKLQRVRNAYRETATAASEACPISARNPNFRPHIYASLSKLSSLMEGREFVLNADDESQDERLFSPRWTQMASILYALSILTTTGYASATPTTLLGQWVAIGYGLLGIPLMVLAAVDVGRFLSEVVLATYAEVGINLHSFKI
uniref:Ion_trans_2 domain-containing protein n=1 Tax=Ascaris lumbricoides TaxID=6252 RepID=A0A0M3ILX1_ASCLU